MTSKLAALRAVAESERESGGQKTRMRGIDMLELLDVAEAAQAFVATTSVFRQRRDSRDEFEALALALLRARGTT